METVFLHGLDSSSSGTKARWFKDHYPEMLIPDFAGPLAERMKLLRSLLGSRRDLVLVGSSFGGLMATVFAVEHPDKLRRVVLLAPALNFPDWKFAADEKIAVPAQLYIGRRDTVCPPEEVLPVAKSIFSDLSVQLTDDDHLLHGAFPSIDWDILLSG